MLSPITGRATASVRPPPSAALEGLADTDKPMELDRAKAISDVAQTIINSARVEVDLCKATGALPTSDFIDVTPSARKPRLVGNG